MKTRDVLSELGFKENCDPRYAGLNPAYQYDFGNLELTAFESHNRYFRPVFWFSGVAWGHNSLRDIDFEMPLEVDSFEQGVAWIAYVLGRKFCPKKPALWLEQGQEWADTLPWVRRLKQYEARPCCSVDREWFRVAGKKLRERAGSADANEMASFEFDGDVLRIKTSSALLAMPAQGVAWDRAYYLPLSKLDFLPKRIMRYTVQVSVWEGRLSIDCRLFNLIDASGGKSEG